MNDRDRQWLAELTKEHQTPFFVLFPRAPQARYFELLDAFQGTAKKMVVCYSVKTNPHPSFLDALSKMESGYELVSLRELKAVESYSTPKLFNACASSDGEIIEAIKQNAIIILDSLSHMEQVARLKKDGLLHVGMRIRFDHHRFGFSPQEVKEAIHLAKEKGLLVTLVHAHPGTNCSTQAYRNFITKVAATVIDLEDITALDLGGGFPGKTTLVERKTGLESYVNIIREQLGSFLKDKTLYLESGRFLVEDAMMMVSKIMHTKCVEGQDTALLDVGINVLSRTTMSPFRFFPLSTSGEKKKGFRLAGPLMFGSDTLGQVYAPLGKGDFIAVENCGAYCTELAWNLSRDKPKIVIVE